MYASHGGATRGWWNHLCRVVDIALNDAEGAVLGYGALVRTAAVITAATGGTAGPVTGAVVLAGSALCGVAKSYNRGKELYDCVYAIPIPDRFYTFDAMVDNTDFTSTLETEIKSSHIVNDIFEPYDEMGKRHNIFLKEIIQKNSVTATTANIVIGKPVEEEGTPQRLDELLVNSSIKAKHIEDAYNNVNTMNYQDRYTAIQSMRNQGVITEKVFQIYKLFYNALDLNYNSCNEIKDVVDEYVVIVKESEDLTSDEKELIYVLLGVLENSIYFWDEMIVH